MNPEKLKESLQGEFEEEIQEIELEKQKAGVSEDHVYEIWVELPKESIREVISYLREFQYPHLTVISGGDTGEDHLDLVYHLSIGYGEKGGEVMINLRTTVSKANPTIPTITDLIPGSSTTEREMHEFLDVTFEGTPDSRHLFLPDDMEVHPWRKDEEELEEQINRLDKQP